jgi:hypothetical protein
MDGFDEVNLCTFCAILCVAYYTTNSTRKVYIKLQSHLLHVSVDSHLQGATPIFKS